MTARLGLLGGTFDPLHSAHLVMAQTARAALGLEKVVLLPAPRPPHKTEDGLSDYRDRLEMARIGAATVEGLEVSDLEKDRSGPSYTVDTLRACRDGYEGDLYFIMGSDSLRELPSWRQPRDILSLCTLVVFPRGEAPIILDVPGPASIVAFESPRIDVSSTAVREKIARGESPGDAVPDEVMDWIRQRGLYQRNSQ